MSTKDFSPSSSRIARLRLMQLVSPSLPIGAYAFSQGFEWAVESEQITDFDAGRDWLLAQLSSAQAHLELPILIRVYGIAEDDMQLAYWNQYILACRETQELWLEDSQLGLALKRVLLSLDLALPKALAHEPDLSYCVLFAFACRQWGISLDDCLTGYCWAWLENQVAAATKLIPLGQTQAQQLLFELSGVIDQAIALARELKDQELGQSLPGLALASCRHETQYSRLFRS